MAMRSDNELGNSKTISGPNPHTKHFGEFKVTALSDGFFDIPTSLLIGYEPEYGVPTKDTMRIDINAFLIETADRKLLVDTGCGDKMGPTVNRLLESLKAVGVAPSEIDTVLCTHIHPDHTNGLIDPVGAAAFQNAEIAVQQDELAFWLSRENLAAAPDEMKPYFEMAHAAFGPYRDRIRTFKGGEEVAKGISTLPLFGHTPGHSGYLIDAGGNQQMLIWGDCVHSIDVQGERPEVTFAADTDQAAARETRLRLYDQVVADNIMVTGMHVTFPGFGHMRKSGGKYSYVPAT